MQIRSSDTVPVPKYLALPEGAYLLIWLSAGKGLVSGWCPLVELAVWVKDPADPCSIAETGDWRDRGEYEPVELSVETRVVI